jgi:GNAT superfamily N-acetyltransferase
MNPLFHIRSFAAHDYGQWHCLWLENMQHSIADTTTQTTWRRIVDTTSPVHGLGAFEDETLVGFLHYVLHPVTGFAEPACYMQDLYVLPQKRRQNIATKLLSALHEQGKKERWARIYWMGDGADADVQAFYKTLGIQVNFTLHMLPTQEF